MVLQTGNNSYKCDFCGKVFSLASVLKTNTFIFTGEKRYKCDTLLRL